MEGKFSKELHHDGDDGQPQGDGDFPEVNLENENVLLLGDGDDAHSDFDPSWLNEGLEGVDDDDIFAEKNKEHNGNNNEADTIRKIGEWYGDIDDDDLHTLYGSSEDEVIPTYPYFNEDVDMVKPTLKVGMKFTSAQIFRKALVEWQVQQGYDLKFIRNENARITAACKRGCGFRIHASPMQGEMTFQIKSLQPVHNCGRSYDNHLVTSKYLSDKYLVKLRDNPDWKRLAMQKEVRRELLVDVSSNQIYRVKRKAKQTIEGDHGKQYARLWDYCETVRKYNPNSCFKIMVERPTLELPPVFQRIYVRYESQKHGFLSGCRPIIGLDGCHLRGAYTGQILAAVCRDGNDNMFPIALAVVEAELKETWMWFLTELLSDIGSAEDIMDGFLFQIDKKVW